MSTLATMRWVGFAYTASYLDMRTFSVVALGRWAWIGHRVGKGAVDVKPTGDQPVNLNLVQRAYHSNQRAQIEWIKAHAGEKRNEEANRLANEARQLGSRGRLRM